MNIRRFTKFALVLTILALIAGLSACDQVQQLLLPATPQMEGLRGEIAIGVVHPITGRLGLDNPPLGQGFELAVTEINSSQLSDVKIKLIVEDGQSTPEGAVEAFNKLIHQDGVSAILGPATSMQAQAVFPIAQQNGVVAISPTSAARGLSAIGDSIFRIAPTTDVLIPSGIRITQEKLGYKKVATIYDEADLFSTDSEAVVKEALAANGIEILTTETFQTGETDFSAQLTRIKDSSPDAIFISAPVIETPEILVQGRQLGIPTDVPFLITFTLASSQIEPAGDAAEGAITFTSWVSTADTPGNQAFVQNYRAAYGAEPDVWAAQSYATVYILAKAISDAQSADPNAIRDALANITDFNTILGKFSFNAVGDAVYEPIVLIVKDGEFQVFE
ncbi:ABC transporter substrate-binding protein [Candidatus Poribacteria bacterium]|nr:ABC transporter substrate-binding protein [Candidatus Poribacteria bacterium]